MWITSARFAFYSSWQFNSNTRESESAGNKLCWLWIYSLPCLVNNGEGEKTLLPRHHVLPDSWINSVLYTRLLQLLVFFATTPEKESWRRKCDGDENRFPILCVATWGRFWQPELKWKVRPRLHVSRSPNICLRACVCVCLSGKSSAFRTPSQQPRSQSSHTFMCIKFAAPFAPCPTDAAATAVVIWPTKLCQLTRWIICSAHAAILMLPVFVSELITSCRLTETPRALSVFMTPRKVSL